MEKPSIILKISDGNHKLVFGESSVIGTDFDEFEVIIPIICDKCNHRIFHKDDLTVLDSHERNMGQEIFRVNHMDDIFCPKCKSPIHIQVEVTEYAHNFMFNDYENKHCTFSHVYDMQKLSD